MAPGLLLKKTNQLKPYLKNARTHSKEQVASVANSIKEFGFTNPILLGKGDVIIAGHCRLLAAQELGLSEVPCLDLSQLTKKQTQAYVLADNQLAQNSGWDMGILKSEIEELQDLGFDLDLLGFSQDFLDELLADDEPVNELTDGDAMPEDVDTRCKLGDVWLLGEHRLMCGDSTAITDVDKLLDGAKVDMVFTDPPYGVSFQSGMSKGGTATRFDVLENDDKILDIMPIVLSSMKDNCAAFIWTSHQVYQQWRIQFDSIYKQTIIWYKHGGGIGDLEGAYACDFEMALFCVNGRPTFKGKRGMAVWDIAKDSANKYVHSTQKPVELALKAIQDFTNNGNSILDLFGGSGSTLIACEKSKRKCFMMELDPKYCDVILKRWEDFTGKNAVMEVSNG